MTTSVILPIEPLALADTYLNTILKQCEDKSAIITADFLEKLRQKATAIVSQSKMPSKKDEEWRLTDLSELVKQNFQVAAPVALRTYTLLPFTLPEAHNSSMVFVNGFYSPELSNVSGLPEGIYVGNLAGLPLPQKEKIVNYLAQQEGSAEVFTALNTAGLTDIAIVWAKSGVVVNSPLELLFLSVVSETPTFSQPRILVIAEKDSSLQIVEYYGALTEGCSDFPKNAFYFTNAVTEIWIEENAQINHTRIQRESGDGFHIAKTAIAQSCHSRYTCNEINLGGRLYRHNLEVYQKGEQTETYLNGLAMLQGKQVGDTHSAVYLNHPHGTTNQLHKCIVDNSAHAIFSGKIFVPKAAQLTNAAQLNQNLLLSPKARVNTKPELQITADNVKCSHGATISQLEADQMFYLRSRGLNEADARHLLIDAFATEILERLPLESIRQRLTQCVACRTID